MMTRANFTGRRTPTNLPGLSRNALAVLRRRYLTKNAAGRVMETPDEMFRRVAGDIARAEAAYPPHTRLAQAAGNYYRLMRALEFLPNSPTLMNAGRPLQQLSACFVLPIDDSLDSIFDTLKHQALIHQSGGGTGFSFSRLRPKDDRVATTSGVASGPVSFMHIFNTATDVIKQGGTRRGANMGILRIDHPDILDFIDVKRKPGAMNNFNLSVGITDAFMTALDQRRTYALNNPRTGKPTRRLAAQEVFDRLVQAAWENGEPGVVFLDTIGRQNPTPHLGAIEATNPCGEQPLLPHESCTLGSLNLSRFVTGSPDTPTIDYPRLTDAIVTAVRFLDGVIDRNHYPLPVIEERTKSTRKIGLGVMGFADLLIRLGIPYDTTDAVETGEGVMRFIHERAHEASVELAKSRGPFPAFAESRMAAIHAPRRHATVTTVAPTGTISIIADCSPGIEPLYGVSFMRTVMDNVRLISVHPDFVRLTKQAGIYSARLLRRVTAQESIQSLSEIPRAIRQLFVTAHDIPPSHHVRMQAAFQRHSDSGVSKTINLPPQASRKDVAEAFLLAYRLGCKGLTVFRSGSRDAQVMSCAQIEYCDAAREIRS
ncbi:MAG: adenosylcobalamin-dependent ribonucleoside-diphosphate reductase [Nitrospiraceae bacterium]|nr:adenosylcobalamin-dependent ribonucleoside-diphosphate reductase [Nitrospiraceae bacterium]